MEVQPANGVLDLKAGTSVCLQCGEHLRNDQKSDNNLISENLATSSTYPSSAIAKPKVSLVVDDPYADDDEEEDSRNTNQLLYVRACTMFRVTPSSHFLHSVADIDVSMDHRPLGDTGIKPIATTLVTNTTVKRLSLAWTGMGVEGLGHVIDLLQANTTIKELNISNNDIGPVGAQRLRDEFVRNSSIIALDITGNGYRDDDARCLADIIQENTVLKELRIGKNSLGEKAADCFGQALGHNSTLKNLDLSWNHIRHRGAITFCQGIQNNSTLETLNLSWNGFGLEGCHELGKALKVNRSITDLDLSANRVNFDCFKLILRGLKRNNSIITLKIGHNPITTDGAMAILQAVCDDRCTSLVYLDMADVSVDGEFLSLLSRVQGRRRLVVRHGTALRHEDLRKGEAPVVLDTDDPLTILFECVKTRNLRLIDLLRNLDKDGSDTLSREELRRGLQEIDIPLSQRSLDILMSRLDINRDGQVDFSELQTRYKEHIRRIARLHRDADVDLKNYKNFDRLEQLREMVRVRLSFSTGLNR